MISQNEHSTLGKCNVLYPVLNEVLFETTDGHRIAVNQDEGIKNYCHDTSVMHGMFQIV